MTFRNIHKIKILLILLCTVSFNNLTFAETLSVGTIERPPFMFYDEEKKITGFAVELWQEIAAINGFDYNWKPHTAFAEMIDEVSTGQVDLALSNISITSSREKKADFSHPFFTSGMAIAVKKQADTNYLRLIWDSGIVWFLLSALSLIFFVANFIWFFERGTSGARHEYFRKNYISGVWDAFWWAFVILTMGGFENEVPNRAVNRLLAMFWIIVSLFFISTLTAKITTALTVAELTTGIESYEDLNGQRIGVTEGSSHQLFLENHNLPTIEYSTLDELYQALEQDKVDAIVADFPILSYFASQAGASWMMLAGNTFNPEDFGILLPDNSSLTEGINNALLTIRENGKYQALYIRYFGNP